MKEDLKHLKWKLINQDKLSVEEADDRIRELEKFVKKNSKDAGKNIKSD